MHACRSTLEDPTLDFTGAIGKVSTRIALQVGHTPASYYSAEPNIPAQAGTGASNADLWRIIQQALVAYTFDSGLVVDAGIFLDPIGPEGLAIKDQWNWSRSDLFFALPFYHAGVRATYPLTSEIVASAFVTNGWNDIVNVNPYPCIAGSLAYTRDDLNVTVSYFGGVEPPTGSPEGQPWRHLFDVSAVWKPIDDLAFAAQGNAGYEDNPAGRSSWVAGAAYAHYQLPYHLAAATRFDAFHEHDAQNPAGTIPRLFFPANDVRSATLTLDATVHSNLRLMLELRHDHGSAPMFFSGDVTRGANGLDIPNATSQNTLALGAVGWF